MIAVRGELQCRVKSSAGSLRVLLSMDSWTSTSTQGFVGVNEALLSHSVLNLILYTPEPSVFYWWWWLIVSNFTEGMTRSPALNSLEPGYQLCTVLPVHIVKNYISIDVSRSVCVLSLYACMPYPRALLHSVPIAILKFIYVLTTKLYLLAICA